MFDVASLLNGVTEADLATYAPKQEAPEIGADGQPVVLWTMDEEWKKHYTLWAKCNEALRRAEVLHVKTKIGDLADLVQEVADGIDVDSTKSLGAALEAASSVLADGLEEVMGSGSATKSMRTEKFVSKHFATELHAHLKELEIKTPEGMPPVGELALCVCTGWEVCVAKIPSPRSGQLPAGLMEALASHLGIPAETIEVISL